MATARRATAADLDEIVAMGRALHEESPRYRGMQFDPDKVRHLAGELMTLAGLSVVFMVESDGEVQGMAAVVATQRWFGPDRYITDLAVYVKPQHRGNGAFPLLVHAIQSWAREQGVADLDLGVSTDIDAGRTVRAYERMGFTVSSTRVMTKRLDDVHRT